MLFVRFSCIGVAFSTEKKEFLGVSFIEAKGKELFKNQTNLNETIVLSQSPSGEVSGVTC